MEMCYTVKKIGGNFPHIQVNSEGSSCKVIYEERFINIWRNARIFTSHMRKPVVIY